MERDFLATTTAGECNALIFPHKTELPTSPLQCLYFPLPLNDAMILLWEPCYQKEDWKEATHIAALLAYVWFIKYLTETSACSTLQSIALEGKM